METLEIVKSQVSEILKVVPNLPTLQSVIIHIERAENFLQLGNDSDDEHYFTDVIYRTNHAFEGILKEAYKIFTTKNPDKKTTYDIEKYLLDNKILNERVIELLTNYRKQWRNPSTHEYHLFFSYSEAYLAIISVSAFIHVLLIQIIEKIYFEREKAIINNDIASFSNAFNKEFHKLSLLEKSISVFQAFLKNKHSKRESDQKIYHYEAEVIAQLTAYFDSIDKSIKIDRGPIIENGDRRFQPDLILKSKNEKVLVDIKISRQNRSLAMSERMFEDRMIAYLVNTNIKNGILFKIPDINLNDYEIDITQYEIKLGSETGKIIKLEPSIKKNTSHNIQKS